MYDTIGMRSQVVVLTLSAGLKSSSPERRSHVLTWSMRHRLVAVKKVL
jgi:hypothetical protein